jgi:RNA polymerase sporulation-specific sigma factor
MEQRKIKTIKTSTEGNNIEAPFLPLPLSPAEEEQVMADLSSGDKEREREARQTFIERNQRLVMYVVRRFFRPGEPDPIGSFEDLFSIGLIGLIKAARAFDPKKRIKFSTFATKCIQNDILMALRTAKRAPLIECSLDEEFRPNRGHDDTMLLRDVVPDPTANTERAALDQIEGEEKMLTEAIAGLRERDRRIISLYFGLYNKNYNPTGQVLLQNQIAKLMGVSQSYISWLIKKATGKLRKELTDIH